VHRESDLITVQQDATYSVYYISVGCSTCFGCWHPLSGARTTVITASGTAQMDVLPSALVFELRCNSGTAQMDLLPPALVVEFRCNSTTRADGSRPIWAVPEAVITVVRAPDDGFQHPKHAELPTEI